MVSTRERDGAYHEFMVQEQSADYGSGGLAPWERRPDCYDYDISRGRGRPQSHPDNAYRHERPRHSRPYDKSGYAPSSRGYDYDGRRLSSRSHTRRQHPAHHPDPYYHYEEERRRRPPSSDGYDDDHSNRSTRTEKHRNRAQPHQQSVTVAPSTRPRSQDAYSEYQKQWEEQCSFSTDVARDAVESYTYSSSPAIYDYDLQQQQPKVDYSLPEEDQQRQAFAEYERMKKERDLKERQREQPTDGSSLAEDPFSPSKMYEKMKTRSKEELMAELRCPSPIRKPPPPPYDLRLTHRPEYWEHTLPNGKPAPPLPESVPEPNPVEEEPPHKEPQPASINVALDEGSLHSVKFSWDAPYPFPIDSCHSERDSPAKKKVISSSSQSNLKPAPIMATTVSYKSCCDDSSSKSGKSGKSSLDDRKMPFKVDGGNGVFHPMPTQPYASASSGKVGAFCEKPQVMIEIQPGYSLPLRGSEETMQAVEAGRVNVTSCMACTTEMVVAEECTFVVCAVCRTVGGVGDLPFSDKKGCVGLGLLKEVYDASRY